MASAINLPGPPLRPRRTDDWRPGLVMALAAHGLLLLALLFSVNWRTTQRETVEAEMWSEIPTAATRSALPPEAVPEPAPTPRPVEPPPPPPPPAPAPEPAPEPAPAEIQTHKEPPKPAKTRPPKEVFDSTPPKPVKKPEPKPKPEPQPAPKPAPAPPPKPKPEPAPKPAPVKPAAAPAPPGPTSAERERARKAAIDRMMADLGGPALSSAGPSGGDYAGRIKARIKPNILFADTIPGNPMAVVEVRCAADGRIIGRRLVTPSGVPTWDDAVLRAIDKTEVLPANERGHVPPVMQIEFKYKDF